MEGAKKALTNLLANNILFCYFSKIWENIFFSSDVSLSEKEKFKYIEPEEQARQLSCLSPKEDVLKSEISERQALYIIFHYGSIKCACFPINI